jgi:hypothetical protein
MPLSPCPGCPGVPVPVAEAKKRLKVGKNNTRRSFACTLKGDPQRKATRFYVGPWENRNLFKAFSHAIQHHFRHGKAPFLVLRTLLVRGALEASMRLRAQAGKTVATPHLEFAYAARDFSAMREMGESWKIVTTPRRRAPSKPAETGCAWKPYPTRGSWLALSCG